MNLLSFDEAQAELAAAVQPLKPKPLALVDASGCVLATDVCCDVDLPPFAASAMDGYAARSSEIATGGTWAVAFEVAAGQAPGALPEGQIARIFTGAPLPAGADCVVKQEDARVDDAGHVQLGKVAAGTNVRAAGELARRGQLVLGAGKKITPAAVAALAASGAAQVHVFSRPTTSLVLTGSELVAVDEKPGPGQIRDSNRYLLQALSQQAGAPCQAVERASDDLDGIIASLDRALHRADLTLCSGGVSVGDYDFVPQAVQDLGGELLFHGVAMKPGKPLLIAQIQGRWLLGLPGNPVSVLAGFVLFGRPLIEALAGMASAFDDRFIKASLASELSNKGRRTLFVPGCLSRSDGIYGVCALDWKGSHDVIATAAADCLIRVEPGAAVARGERVSCLPLS